MFPVLADVRLVITAWGTELSLRLDWMLWCTFLSEGFRGPVWQRLWLFDIQNYKLSHLFCQLCYFDYFAIVTFEWSNSKTIASEISCLLIKCGRINCRTFFIQVHCDKFKSFNVDFRLVSLNNYMTSDFFYPISIYYMLKKLSAT